MAPLLPVSWGGGPPQLVHELGGLVRWKAACLRTPAFAPLHLRRYGWESSPCPGPAAGPPLSAVLAAVARPDFRAAFASSCFFAGFAPPGPALGSVRWELALERSGACWPLLPSPSRPALLPSSAAALPFLQVAWLRPSAALDSRGPVQAFGQRVWLVWATAFAVAIGLFPPSGGILPAAALLHLERLAPARLLDLPLLIAMAAAFAVEGDWQALDEFAAVVVQSWLLRRRPEWVA